MRAVILVATLINMGVHVFLPTCLGSGQLCGMSAVRLADGRLVPDLPPSQQDQSLHQTCGGHSAGLLPGSLLFRLVSLSPGQLSPSFPAIVIFESI